MMIVHKTIASIFGIGYSKGGGTIAAAFCCAVLFFSHAINDKIVLLIAAFSVTIIGVWSSTTVEKEWGEDSSKVVIDEVAGMLVSLLWLPPTLSYIIAAFVLFRFFDIVKPLFIKKIENIKGGWGVMLDDVVAGIYTNVILQLCVFLNLF